MSRPLSCYLFGLCFCRDAPASPDEEVNCDWIDPLKRRPLRLVLLTVILAFALIYVGAVTIVRGKKPDAGSAANRPARAIGSASSADVNARNPDQVGAEIRRQQSILGAHPDNSAAWAKLGSAYVQQARITADPSYYPKATGALQKSMALQPIDNFEAMLGSGALANAQHDFAGGEAWGRRAEGINPYNVNLYAVLNDAATQLGDYPAASAAAQRMLDLRPGVASFTRASYEFEEHGDPAGARLALEKALALATSPSDIAFCRYYLGELLFNEGKPAEAIREHDLGLVADPSFAPLVAGKAKAEAALGRMADARRDYASVIKRVPQPQYVLEFGELEESLGHPAAARRLYELLGVEMQLFTANGVIDDLTAAIFEADHGDPAKALAHAQAEWGRRKSVLVADALAWALHVNHRDGEAQAYSTLANRLGWRNATFAFHQAMIELALGQRQSAITGLQRSLDVNANFNPRQAVVARRTLAELQRPS